MKRPRFGRFLVILAVGATAVGLAACSSGSSSSTAGTSGTAASGSAPEKTTITVDTLNAADSAPLWIAIKNGYFKQQGLTVQINYVLGQALAFPGQAAHTVDFANVNYSSLYGETVTNPSLGLRIVAEDEVSGTNTDVIMVPKNSSIKTPANLKGKVVGFASPGVSVATLALDEQLKGYGITGKDYTANPVGFPAMTQDLESGAIDATFAVPPFITTMETSIGAHELMDLMTGPMTRFPVVGWSTTAWEEQHYPRTVAAFQRAIEEGQQAAAVNPALVRQIIPEFDKNLPQKMANIMALQTYVPTLSETAMQRVATVMEQFHLLPSSFKVAPLIIPLPTGA
jgi:NitT/TauT family transport system substrate-binding protein